MVTEEIKQQLVDTAVNYFLTNENEKKDSISYEILNNIFRGKLYKGDEMLTASLFLVGCVIVHRIPIKDKVTEQYILRAFESCFTGLKTFDKSNKQEKFAESFSNEKQQIDLVSGRVLPSLQFLNTNHEYLATGFGGRGADLIDPLTKTTYEVKSNYQKRGSVSGLHQAHRLIDCAGSHLVIYPVLYDKSSEGEPDYKTVLYRFRAVIPDDVIVQTYAINDELLEVIKSGELILRVETKLESLGFEWTAKFNIV